MANKRIYDLTENTAPASGEFLVQDKSGYAEAKKVDMAKLAILAGQSGGQTLYGGTAANEDLILHGTSNATRTTSYVLLQPTAGNVGIGTTAPSAALHIVTDASSTSDEVKVETMNTSSVMRTRLGVDIAGSNRVMFIDVYGASAAGNNLLGVTAASSAEMVSGGDITGGFHIGTASSATNLTFYTAALPRLTILGSGGNVGIGTTAPDSKLHVNLSDTGTNTAAQVVTISHNGGTAAAGFGSRILWELESSTTDDQTAAALDVLWTTATHASRASNMVWSLVTAATLAEKMRLTGEGNLKLGGTASRGTAVGTNHIDLFDGTAPTGTLANGVSIYSKAGEFYALDAAGNETLNSPHDPETGEWIFWSRNTVTGRTYRVDMERMVAAIEALTGQSFTTETFELPN